MYATISIVNFLISSVDRPLANQLSRLDTYRVAFTDTSNKEVLSKVVRETKAQVSDAPSAQIKGELLSPVVFTCFVCGNLLPQLMHVLPVASFLNRWQHTSSCH